MEDITIHSLAQPQGSAKQVIIKKVSKDGKKYDIVFMHDGGTIGLKIVKRKMK